MPALVQEFDEQVDQAIARGRRWRVVRDDSEIWWALRGETRDAGAAMIDRLHAASATH